MIKILETTYKDAVKQLLLVKRMNKIKNYKQFKKLVSKEQLQQTLEIATKTAILKFNL